MTSRQLLLALFAMAVLCPTHGNTAGSRAKAAPAKPMKGTCDTELILAKKFADLGDWKNAQIHFVAAANETKCQDESLAGIEIAKRRAEAILLRNGEIYEAEHQWSKAEALYSAAASDPSLRDTTRYVAGDRLRSVLQRQADARRWKEWRDTIAQWAKDLVGLIVFLLSMILLVFTIKSIRRHRRVILIRPFAAPTEEVSTGLNIQLKYARLTMNNPAFSRASPIPPFLIENLRFSDEVEPIEDLEIAGSKIPFSSLQKLFGRPRVEVTGGFDGVAPMGNAYSMVKTVDSSADAFVGRQIRVAVPHEQRLDLLDFAYDVIVKASSAYADI
ncbi:MAG TPA: hypothetical protein VGJ33_19805 [Candidatus Angelobacter sp.]